MKITKTILPEVLIIDPEPFRDHRGFFMETYHAGKLHGTGIPESFVQHNSTRSKKGVLRGLHGQLRQPQGKLIRATQGEIFDVAVDVRLQSPRFGQWMSLVLSSENFKELYIPPGFMHGFCVISETADVEYHCTSFYNPSDEFGVRWDDPDLDIQWPLTDPILSPKDQSWPTLSEIRKKLLEIPIESASR